MDFVTIVWLVVGVLLIAGEFVIPGLVAVFLGAAALLVAGLTYTGIIDSVIGSIFAWMALSGGLTVALRSTARRYLPADTSRGQTNEQLQAFGTVVDVLEDITEDDTSGRIRYQGTTWPATSTQGPIPKGEQAQLVVRENLAWVVEPAGTLPEPDAPKLLERGSATEERKEEDTDGQRTAREPEASKQGD